MSNVIPPEEIRDASILAYRRNNFLIHGTSFDPQAAMHLRNRSVDDYRPAATVAEAGTTVH